VYNSNLLLTPLPHDETYGYWTSPAAEFAGKTERLEVSGRIAADFVSYYGGQQNNFTNIHVPVTIRYKTEKDLLGFTGGFNRDNTLMSELLTTGVVLSFTQRNQWTANPSWTRRITEKLSFQSAGQLSDTTYENGVHLGLVDYQLFGGSGGLLYQMTEQTQIQLSGSYVNFHTINAPSPFRASFPGVNFNLTHAFTETLTGTIYGGPRFVSSTTQTISENIKIDMNDGRTLEAKLIGSDPPSDLALLKVNSSGLTFMTPGDSEKVRVGDVALAIGNPLGVGQTVTMGIISAKGRQTGLSNGSFEDFLQTDAPINRGNSGGALVSTNSELIGINSQILSPSGGSIGLGFAIPSNMARNVMDQLINTGKVRRGQLGIVVLPIPSEEASSLGVKEGPGVVVYQVQAGSGAERAGLRRGDVITALNGQAVTDPNSFRNAVASTPPGSEITLTVKRDGSERQVRATLGEFTPQAERPRDQE